MKNTCWIVGLTALLLATAACKTRVIVQQAPPAPPPMWATQPKMTDSVNMYVIGTSQGQPTMAAAREAAMEDAMRQLSRTLVTEAGTGDQFLSASGTLPLSKVEMVPGCFHSQYDRGAYNAWVQVSFPITERRARVEQLRNAR